MPMDDDLVRRVASLEERVASLEAALLKPREEPRTGDADAAPSVSRVARQAGVAAGVAMRVRLACEPGSIGEAARRFEVAFEGDAAEAPSASPAVATPGRAHGRRRPRSLPLPLA